MIGFIFLVIYHIFMSISTLLKNLSENIDIDQKFLKNRLAYNVAVLYP